MRYLYTLLLGLISPFWLWALYRPRSAKPSVGSRWKEHFGSTPKLQGQRPIWIHAVSVGEVMAATALIKALKQAYPATSLLITTTTSTGAEQAQKLAAWAEHRYMPLDFPWAIRAFLKRVRPQQLLIIETELWPNTLHLVHQAGIEIKIINARLSEKSCQNYLKIRPLFRLLPPCITQVLCQSQADADRFTRLGFKQTQLAITGSIKFDLTIAPELPLAAKQLREQLGTQRPIWIAASTHKGEDELILAAHHTVLEHFPTALLILVPRHPERFDTVFELCQSQLASCRRTKPALDLNRAQVYLADTMGELLLLLATSDLCFMGGSLIGDKVGGHNVLEPAALGVPVITGGSYFNFKEIVHQMREQQAIIILKDATSLASHLIELFSQPQQRQALAQAALQLVKKHSGALTRTLSYIKPKDD